MTTDPILKLLSKAKKLACEYRKLTGKPLGITGEVAEYEAARLLGLQLTPARQAGFDAVQKLGGRKRYLQIKGRCILPNSKPSERMGVIDIDKKFDAVLLVLLDERLNATEIHEASRAVVINAIGEKVKTGLHIKKFKKIGKPIWPLPTNPDML